MMTVESWINMETSKARSGLVCQMISGRYRWKKVSYVENVLEISVRPMLGFDPILCGRYSGVSRPVI